MVHIGAKPAPRTTDGEQPQHHRYLFGGEVFSAASAGPRLCQVILRFQMDVERPEYSQRSDAPRHPS